jgi:two-component system sensor histidine kinase CpxA
MTVYIGMFVFAPAFFISIRDLLSLQGKQEKTILNEMLKKNTYLEHAAKILRHDMHSGINTYIPRGIRSIERRLDEKTIERLKLESPLRLLKEGLAHTQQVYKGVYEFTDLVRQDSKLEILPVNIKNSLESYLKRTSYKDQVIISEMPEIYINEALFCTAIDNLIRNGLKYNDSDTKWVKIYMKDSNTIAVVDNGRGMSKDQFKKMIQPYARIKDQKESGSGLGLNICVAILGEHGFKVSSKKLEKGTEIAIDISNGVKF